MLTDHGANYALYQRDYPAADVKEVRFEGRTFYYPAQSGAPLYHEPFPAVLSQDAVNRMTCIGDSLSDGFTIKTQEIGGQ